MSYQQFQQRCKVCGAQWNAAFGIVGMTLIASPPVVCPKCHSPEIEHAESGWKLDTIGEARPNETAQVINADESAKQ